MKNILIQHIELTPGIAGGKPRVSGHRITVQDIVIWHERMGMNADEIATEYGITLSDVYAALAYYYDHRMEIDKSIKADESFITELRRHIPSRLKEKIGD
ncbi:MAG: DUF433 domain-containing protein [Nitrospirae bacterium]|nr:DUF433 domain-containing protein [Nitrospirota bacterium]